MYLAIYVLSSKNNFRQWWKKKTFCGGNVKCLKSHVFVVVFFVEMHLMTALTCCSV